MSDEAHAPANEQFYLVMLVGHELLADVEEHARAVCSATGLALYDARLKLRKPGLTLLLRSNRRDDVERAQATLAGAGYFAHLLSRSQLRSVPAAQWVMRAERDGDAIVLCASDDSPRLRVTAKTHLLIAATDIAESSDHRVRDAVERGWAPSAAGDVLRRMASGTLALRVFSADEPQGVVLSAARFNFGALGEARGQASSQNILTLLELLSETAARVHIDVHAEVVDTLPVPVDIDARQHRRALERLEVHARTLYLLWSAGALQAFERRMRAATPPDTQAASAATGAAALPTPGAVVRGGIDRHGRGVSELLRQLRGIGPLALVIPLISVATLGLIAARELEHFGLLLTSLVAVGLLGMLWGFTCFRRKRLIEDFPTSKVRSLALGHVELIGRALQETALKTPFSGLDCIYYRARIEERRDYGSGGNRVRGWRVRQTLSSGPEPFYLEDDTGRVRVVPDGALYDIATRHVLHRPLAAGVDWGRADRDRAPGTLRYVEEFIPAGCTVYVLGTADIERTTLGVTARHMAERLRDVKRNPARLAELDTNLDGRVDEHEWQQAVANIERDIAQAVLENPDETRQTPVIRRGELDDFFMISDHNPDELVRRLHWVSVLAFFGGLALVLFSAYQAIHNTVLL